MNHPSHYELLPDGTLFMMPVKRSFEKVLDERSKVARWFDPNTDKVLSGSCTLSLASLRFDDNKMSFVKSEVSEVLEMQDIIDVYNNITAEQVIEAYKRNLAMAP